VVPAEHAAIAAHVEERLRIGFVAWTGKIWRWQARKMPCSGQTACWIGVT